MDSAIEGLQFGAFDYVMKPADIDDIVNKAYEAFEKRRRLDEKIRGLTSGHSG
jgi:DNA-binding NtrC family response regulator